MRRGAIALLALAALAVAAVFYGGDAWRAARTLVAGPATGSASGESTPMGPPGGARAVPVETARVTLDTVVVRATAVGTLLSNESVIVRPEIAGRITRIHFDEGQRVEKGQLLFSLDDEIYRAELADARAELVLRRRNYERAKELFAQQVGTARARDEALAAFERAKVAIELAETRLAKARIRAPFAGEVGLRTVSVGAYVAVGQDLVNLEDIDPLKVDFQIPERYLDALGTGQTVRVTADALPGRTFEGRVYAVNPQVNPKGRSLHIRARIDNADRVLRPGLFVRVALELGRREDAILVPEQAIVPRGKNRFVFRVEDGRAAMVPVEIGQRRYGMVEITRGLSPGDVVVTAGQLKIGDGAPVRPVANGAAPASGDAGG